jgi:hypothetical protein
MEVVQSVSQVLGLQRLLEQSDVVELFEGFSQSQWDLPDQDGNDTGSQDGGNGCNSDVFDQYIPYFCGTLRKNTGDLLKSILDHNCNGDSYRRGIDKLCSYSAV